MHQYFIFLFFQLISISALAHESIVAEDAVLKQVGSVAFLEGPAWHRDGSLYFTDIPNDRIMHLSATGEMSVWKKPSGWANGLVFDHQGRLIAAEDHGRRISRYEHDGAVTHLLDSFNGQPLNSPNDLAIDSRGRVYFTDPAYRKRETKLQKDASGEIVDGVYRIDGPGQVERLIVNEVSMPNGLIVSPGDEFLYVTDNDIRKNGNRKLWRFALTEEGKLVANSKTLMFDWETEGGPDGLAIDTEGRIYVAAGFKLADDTHTADKYKPGIYVISSEGRLLEIIQLPDVKVSNVTFGGENLDTLYITAGRFVRTIKTKSKGYLVWPTAKKLN